MQKNVRRSTLSAAAVITALVLSACGGPTEADDGARSAEKREPVVPALSEETLAELAVSGGEVPGFTVKEGTAGIIAVPPRTASADPEQCAPYLDLVNQTAPGVVASRVARTATEQAQASSVNGAAVGDDGWLDIVRFGVASYEGDGARAAMRRLREWTGACRDGFAVGRRPHLVADRRAKAAARGADEAVTFTVLVDFEGGWKPMSRYAVYREGRTVVTFAAMNGELPIGKGDGDWGVPDVLVDTQLARLR